MGKIKKLDELRCSSEIDSDELQKLRGGGRCQTSTVGGGPIVSPVCACGCGGCSWDSGGSGTSVGMTVSNVDGGAEIAKPNE